MTSTPPAAFLSLLRVQQEPLLRAARLLTGDWAAAEDLLRRTLAWALAHWGTFEEDATPAALVVRLRMIALYLADAAEEDDDPDAAPGWPAEAADGLDPGADGAARVNGSGGAPADVEDPTTIIGRSTSLVDSLTVLAPKDRAVVVGRYYLSLSAPELAGMLGIDAEDVDADAVSILAALRRRVAQLGGNG